MERLQNSEHQTGMISDIETGYDPNKGHFSIYAGTYQSRVIYETTRKSIPFCQINNIPLTALKFNKNQEYLIYATGDDWYDENEKAIPVFLFIKKFEYEGY